MRVPFIKAHGAGNDFLFTLEKGLAGPLDEDRRPLLAQSICDRHRGVGADGWYLVEEGTEEADAVIHLYNCDGSRAELSGNGTRCAASILVDRGLETQEVRILTGAGLRKLNLTGREGNLYRFEMEMGRPKWRAGELRHRLQLSGGPAEVTIVDVGNPQCAVFVDSLDFDWRSRGAEIEGHPFFPERTNVSFLRRLSDHAVEARFYERGAGPTLSSGTGATGAAVAAVLLQMAASPVRVETEAGEMEVKWETVPEGPVFLRGPAEITARGEYFWRI